LPATVHPTTRYLGQPRLIVPTVRSSRAPGEALVLRVIVLDNERPRSAVLHWRPLGQKAWRTLPLRHVARAVHTATLPAAGEETVEYFIEAETADGRIRRWPPTAPALNQTVVVMPARS